MANSKIEICNNALSRIGSKRINSFEDTNESARQCSLIYEEKLSEMLSSHDWGFATKKVKLALLGSVEEQERISEYKFSYALPSDFLRIISMNPNGVYYYAPRPIIPSYSIVGRTIETDIKDPVLTYTRMIDNPADLPSYFVKAFIYVLAEALVVPLKDNTSMLPLLTQQAEFYSSQARVIDLNQRGPHFVDLRNRLSDIRRGK